MGAFRYKGNVYPYFNGTYNGTVKRTCCGGANSLSYLNSRYGL